MHDLFTALMGQEQLKAALVLNFIVSSLDGLFIRGEKWTVKSNTVVCALADLFSPLRADSFALKIRQRCCPQPAVARARRASP